MLSMIRTFLFIVVSELVGGGVGGLSIFLSSFLQLIKMDLPKQSPFFEDFNDLEKATHRCIEIVQKLL